MVGRVQRHSYSIACAACLLTISCSSTTAAPRGVRPIAAGSDTYVALNDLADFYGMRLSSRGNTVTARSKWSELQFSTHSRKAHFNGMRLWLHGPTTKIRRKWSLTETDMATAVDPLLRPDVHLRNQGYRVVILDPGHGGKDRGARGRRGVEEKRAVLDVAKRARVHLANAGLKVYLTRDGDRSLTLGERCRKAARWGGNLFVSIHLNSSTTAGAKGIETYVLTAPGYPPTNGKARKRAGKTHLPGHRFAEANTILGYHLHRNLLDRTGNSDRGLRRAGFYVLKNAPCPATLIEMGFLSNKAEEEKVLEASYREKLAQAITKGILDYVDAVKRARLAAP